MKYKRKVVVILITVCLIAYLLFGMTIHKSKETDIYLPNFSVSVYGSYVDVYRLNIETKSWDVVAAGIGNQHKKQSIDIFDGSIYFYNTKTGYVESMNISSLGSPKRIFEPMTEITVSDSIVVRKESILYTCSKGLCEYVFDTETHTVLYKDDFLEFSCNNEDVFLVKSDRGIYNLNDVSSVIAYGINLFALSENRIAYYENDKDIIQILDIASKEVIVSFDMQYALYSMSVDSRGEYICMGRIVQDGLFNHKMVLSVLDTSNNEIYLLPSFPVVTKCFIID